MLDLSSGEDEEVARQPVAAGSCTLAIATRG